VSWSRGRQACLGCAPDPSCIFFEFRHEEHYLYVEVVAGGVLRHIIQSIMEALLDDGNEKLMLADVKAIRESEDRNLLL